MSTFPTSASLSKKRQTLRKLVHSYAQSLHGYGHARRLTKHRREQLHMGLHFLSTLAEDETLTPTLQPLRHLLETHAQLHNGRALSTRLESANPTDPQSDSGARALVAASSQPDDLMASAGNSTAMAASPLVQLDPIRHSDPDSPHSVESYSSVSPAIIPPSPASTTSDTVEFWHRAFNELRGREAR